MLLKRRGYMRDAGISLLLSLLVLATFAIAFPAAPAVAVQPPPSVSVTPNVVVGGSATAFSVEVSNPTTNSYAITAITVSAPPGWKFTYGASPAPCTAPLGTLEASSPSAFTCSGNLLPGYSVTLGGGSNLQLTGPTPGDVNAIVGTFSTSVRDASSPAFYAGPTFTVYATGPSPSLTITFPSADPCSGANYVAGSGPCSATVTVSTTGSVGIAGLPVIFTTDPNSAASPTSATTGSTGKASTTWQPSNVAGTANMLTATLGTSSFTDSKLITVVAGAPSKVVFASPFSGTHYVTTSTTVSGTLYAQETAISYNVADAFGNPIAWGSITFGSGQGITLTATAGGGGFSDGTAIVTSISCTGPGCNAAPWTPGSLPSGTSYVQSSVYNSIGLITATVTGTIGGTSFSVSGSTGNIITSTFAGSAPTPAVSPTSVKAGGTVTVSATLSPAQQGVPVTLFLNTAASSEPGNVPYGTSSQLPTTFPNGDIKITLTTDSAGKVSAKFTVDTVAGSVAVFRSKVAQPIDGNPANVLTSADSSGVNTIAGDPAKFVIDLFFTNNCNTSPCPAGSLSDPVGKNVVPGATVWVNVGISDNYGNPTTNPGPSNIQITLSASLGALSATTVYITANNKDTLTSFGPISWSIPSTAAVGSSATLSASGVLGGSSVSVSRTLNIVSPNPTIAVSSPKPIDGIIYSKTTATIFSGTANISVGKNPTVRIASVAFKLDTAPWQPIAISPASKITWWAVVTASEGLHTIAFNATDSEGSVGVTSTLRFLVDTRPPSIAFVTANKSVVQAGGAVSATITDALGALNFTSVSATRNGTAIPSSSITVSGTNNPGSSVTYTVSIGGLPTGTWSIKISACDLAGNCATSKALIVTVIVPLDQSFTLVGTPGKVTVAGQTAVNATFTNNLPFTQSGIVMLVVRNLQGQTVYIATATVSPSAGATFSALLVVSPVPPGTYTVELFAITSTGVVIAKSTTFTLTLP